MDRGNLPVSQSRRVQCVCPENEPIAQALAAWRDEAYPPDSSKVYDQIRQRVLDFPVPIRDQSMVRQLEGVDSVLSFKIYQIIKQAQRVPQSHFDWCVQETSDFDRIFRLVQDEFKSQSQVSMSRSQTTSVTSTSSLHISASQPVSSSPAFYSGLDVDVSSSRPLRSQLISSGNAVDVNIEIKTETKATSTTAKASRGKKAAATTTPPPEAQADATTLGTKKKAYVPQPRSGSWAILIAFVLALEKDPTLTPDTLKLDRSDIVQLASPYSKSSFESNANQFYSAWDGRKALANAGWLLQSGRNPIMYALTAEGWRAAVICYTKELGHPPVGVWATHMISDSMPAGTIDTMSSSSVMTASGPFSATPQPSSALGSSSPSLSLMVPILGSQSSVFSSSSPTTGAVLERTPSITSSSAKTQSREIRRVPSSNSSRASPATPLESAAVRIPRNTSHRFDPTCDDFLQHFEIVILIDIRERDLYNLLQRYSDTAIVLPVVLSVGDILWCARHKATQQMFVLDAIIERKTITDMFESVRDSRYREQRARLKKTQLRQVMYFVEGHLNRVGGGDGHYDYKQMVGVCQTVIAKLTSVFGFQVLNPNSLTETARMIIDLHEEFIAWYKNASAIDLQPFSSSLAGAHVKGEGEFYPDFELRMKKRAKMTRWKLFGMQLRQIRGCSPKVTMAIVKHYPTPAKLMEAFATAERLQQDRKGESMTRKEADRINPKYLLTHINCAPEEGEEQFIGKAVSEAIYEFFRGDNMLSSESGSDNRD